MCVCVCVCVCVRERERERERESDVCVSDRMCRFVYEVCICLTVECLLSKYLYCVLCNMRRWLQIVKPLAYQLKDDVAQVVPRLDWLQLKVSDTATLNGAPWKCRHGDILLVKDSRRPEAIDLSADADAVCVDFHVF